MKLELAPTHAWPGRPGQHFPLTERRRPNRLPAEPVRPFWRRFVSQLTDLPTLILMAGAGLSALAGRTAELLAAGAATALTALVGAWREGQESSTASALRALTPRRATVVRGGKEQAVAAASLVPGDQVIMQAGDLVPADVVVTRSRDLLVDDRHLLGAQAGGPRPVPQGRLVHAGCAVVRGRASGHVEAIDGQTLLGKVARSLHATDRPPSLVESRMGKLTRQLLKVALGALGVVFVAGILRGMAPVEVLQSGFGLAAAVVPEGLPIYLTLALAAGARRMARRSAYVRDLALAETAGAVDVICTDKTGTLTRGELTVRSVCTGGRRWSVTGVGFDLRGRFLREGEPVNPLDDTDLRIFLETAVRCNNAKLVPDTQGASKVEGSQTEGALLVMARKAGLPTGGLPGEPLSCSKGAPESILPLCTRQLWEGDLKPLDDAARTQIMAQAAAMARSGERVLALAYAPGHDRRHGFIFAGLAGMVDPVRHELRPVIQQLARDHIRTVMITGDHPETAAFVACELGLPETVATGADIARLTDEQLARLAAGTAVFARVTPEQKARIIQALQRRGRTVAYIGDGIDDAPAIRAADVGAVPQHRAAELTKEAAGIILADDRFETLVEAIRQGRATAANTGEITRFLLAGNTAEILLLVACAVAGLPMALLPLQLLWLNLIADGPAALGIAERQAHPGVTLPKKPQESVTARGLEMGAAAFGLYISAVLGGAPVAAARTMVLGALAVGQILYLMRCQTTLGTPCGLKFPGEPTVAVATGLSGLLILATLYFPPLASALGTVPLNLGQWLAVMAAALAGNLSAAADFKLQRAPQPAAV